VSHFALIEKRVSFCNLPYLLQTDAIMLLADRIFIELEMFLEAFS